MKKAIFLDRDGVINEVFSERVQFVNSSKDFYLLPGVADAIALLRDLGYKIFLVTNQGGMTFGYMTLSTLNAIHDKMKAELLAANEKALIDDILFCPHNPKGNCECRKPRPGMIITLAERYNIDLSQSYMIGDMESDILAGRAAGCQTVWIGKDYPDLISFAKKLASP